MRALKQHMQLMLACVVVATLTACAGLGLPTPETFAEKAAAAYAVNTQIVESTKSLLVAKKISPDDADNVLKGTDVAKAGIDTARKIHATDPAGADGKLNAIRTGLTAVRQYLTSRGGT